MVCEVMIANLLTLIQLCGFNLQWICDAFDVLHVIKLNLAVRIEDIRIHI